MLSDTGRAPHRTTAHIIVQRRHSATMPRRRHPLILAALATAAALRQPPRRIAAEKTLRVLIADVGDEVQWLPGDRRTIRRPSPSQAAALNAAAAEALFSESPALVAMLPTVAQEEYPQNDEAVLAPGGGGRRVRYQEGVHDEGTRRDGQSAFRRAFMDAKQTSSGLRVAALCAVRGVRTAGSREAKGVRPIIERATLEVVGRVAVKRLEVLAEKDERLLVRRQGRRRHRTGRGRRRLGRAPGRVGRRDQAEPRARRPPPATAGRRLRAVPRSHPGAAPRHVGRFGVEINQAGSVDPCRLASMASAD